MADIALLKRVKAIEIQIPPEIDVPAEHPDALLGRDMQALFNYSMLKKTVDADATRVKEANAQRERLLQLIEVLSDNEVDIAPNDSVEKYQKQMVAECSAPFIRATRFKLIFLEVFLSSVFLVFLFLFVRFFPNYFFNIPAESGMPVLGFLVGIVMLFLAVVILIGAVNIKNPDILEFEWKSKKIGDYGKEIPVKALRIARDVKKALTGADLYIEYIKQKERPPQNMDPFMYIFLDGKRYYVAFWDEPKFESEINPI